MVFMIGRLYLEMNYTSNERVECFIKGFGFDFDNEEGNEDKMQQDLTIEKTMKFEKKIGSMKNT